MRLLGLVLCCLLLACADARAAISGATVVDGPSADVIGLDGVAMAEDGTGGLIYRKRVDGRVHVFVARYVDGELRPPVRVDTTNNFDSGFPALGAGNGGRLVAVWTQEFGVNSDRLFSASLQPGGTGFERPLPIDFNIDEAVATYPSLAMNRAGQAYLSYRVLPGGGRSSVLPPGYVNSETRVQRYNGALWSQLGSTANRNPSIPNREPTPENSPKMAIDVNGNGMIAFQEPDDGFVDRVYARRIFGLSYGIPLAASPTVIGDRPLPGGANAFSLEEEGFGAAAIAVRQDPGEDSPQRGTRIYVNQIPEAFSKDAATFRGARPADGGGDAGLGVLPGPPDVALTPKGGFITTFGADTASLSVAGDESNVGAADRLDDGATDVTGQPVVELARSGAATWAWRVRQGGRSAIKVRERRSDGIQAERFLFSPRGGAIDGLRSDGSGFGDALLGFVQGAAGTTQIVAGAVNAAPSDFIVNTPVDFVRGATIPLSWDPAPNAIGRVSYTVTVDDEVVAEGTPDTKLTLRGNQFDDGRQTVSVVATDSAGQQTSSAPGELKVDNVKPRVSVRRLSGRRVRVSVTDGVKEETAGLVPESTRVVFGDGRKDDTKERFTHRFRRAGTFTVRVGAKDAAGNRIKLNKRVRVR